MVLLDCPQCLDMKKLRMLELRFCVCGNSWGYHLDDDLTAEIGGDANLKTTSTRAPDSGN